MSAVLEHVGPRLPCWEEDLGLEGGAGAGVEGACAGGGAVRGGGYVEAAGGGVGEGVEVLGYGVVE